MEAITDNAMNIANRFIGKNVPLNKRIKKLGEEVVELAMAIQKEEYEGHIKEEIGDCAFLLAHILSIHSPDTNIIIEINNAAHKMKCRRLEQLDEMADGNSADLYTVIKSDREQGKIYLVNRDTALPKVITYEEAKDYIF